MGRTRYNTYPPVVVIGAGDPYYWHDYYYGRPWYWRMWHRPVYYNTGFGVSIWGIFFSIIGVIFLISIVKYLIVNRRRV